MLAKDLEKSNNVEALIEDYNSYLNDLELEEIKEIVASGYFTLIQARMEPVRWYWHAIC